MVKRMVMKQLHLYKSFGLEYCDPIIFQKKEKEQNNLPNSLKSLENYVKHCRLCELSKNGDDRFIGDGDGKSGICFVALRCDFSQQNIFLMLDDILKNILGVKRENLYITNLIKCSSVSTKNIDTAHIDFCKEYFLKEIALIKPKYIIALGDTYKYLLTNDLHKSIVYGNSYDYNGIDLLPMLDLEFVYKNPSYKEGLYNSFKKLKIVME